MFIAQRKNCLQLQIGTKWSRYVFALHPAPNEISNEIKPLRDQRNNISLLSLLLFGQGEFHYTSKMAIFYPKWSKLLR